MERVKISGNGPLTIKKTNKQTKQLDIQLQRTVTKISHKTRAYSLV